MEVRGSGNFIGGGIVSHNTRWHDEDIVGMLMAEPHMRKEYSFLIQRVSQDFEKIDCEVLMDSDIGKFVRHRSELHKLFALSHGVTEKPASMEQVSRRYSVPLWSAKWGKEALLEKYNNMVPRAFERGYRQRPISDEELVFSADAVTSCLDKTMVMPDSGQDPLWLQYPRDAGVDLAIAEASSDGSYFAVVGLATQPDWTRWVLHVHLLRGLSFLQQVDFIKELHHRFAYSKVVVENNNYQRAMVQMLGATSMVPVHGFRTGALQKSDLEVGVPSLASEFERGKLKIPYGNAASRRQADILVQQLLDFTYEDSGRRTDAVLALYFAREARVQQAQSKSRVLMLTA
jgi:hypothetical protein